MLIPPSDRSGVSKITRAARRRRAARPTAEVLEGRALMATSTLDPNFGTAGVVLGPVRTFLTGTSAPTDITAVAVQDDGKIVEVGTYNSSFATRDLAVLRYNADGTPDSTFGINGQVNIPLPAGAAYVSSASDHVVIKPGGEIVFAATYVGAQTTPTVTTSGAAVFQLTTAGELDPTFGVGGVALNSTPGSSFDDVALAGDKVVVLGSHPEEQVPSASSRHLLSVLRLTAAGTLDPTFNGTGVVDLAAPADLANSPTTPYNPVGLAVAPSGRIYAAGRIPNQGFPFTISTLTSITPEGTLDATYGTGGTLVVPGTSYRSNGVDTVVTALGVQSDSKVVVAGYGDSSQPFLRRLNVDGSVDSTFQADTVTGATRFYVGDAVRVTSVNTLTIAPDDGVVLGISNRGYLLVQRLLADGTPDSTFGVGGRSTLLLAGSPSFNGSPALQTSASSAALALNKTTNDLVVATAIQTNYAGNQLGYQAGTVVLRPVTLTPAAGDFDGDGKADIAAYLPAVGVYAIRPSSGGPDRVFNLGTGGAGQTIPGSGVYKAFGLTVANPTAFLTASARSQVGQLADSSSTTETQIGAPGAGNSIPADADYDGDGYTDPAVYLPQYAVFAYRPSAGGPDVLTSFGAAGANASIPAPGDYDGDGKADIAAYLPAYGVLAYRPSSAVVSSSDVLVSFGAAGAGASIPAPGDYDGDGRTDLAVYLPQYGVLAYRPSSAITASADILQPFGAAGVGASIPAPGDYDGDGRTDPAVYLPQYAVFAYRPSSGGPDVLRSFGAPGAGRTVPVASIPYANPATVAGSALRATAGPARADADAPLALTDDILDALAGDVAAARKKAARTA